MQLFLALPVESVPPFWCLSCLSCLKVLACSCVRYLVQVQATVMMLLIACTEAFIVKCLPIFIISTFALFRCVYVHQFQLFFFCIKSSAFIFSRVLAKTMPRATSSGSCHFGHMCSYTLQGLENLKFFLYFYWCRWGNWAWTDMVMQKLDFLCALEPASSFECLVSQ